MSKAGPWTLWELSVVVVVAALILALAAQTQSRLISAGVLSLIFLPPLWAAHAWDRPIRTFLGMSPLPSGPAEAILVWFVWYCVLVMPLAIVIVTAFWSLFLILPIALEILPALVSLPGGD